MRRIVTSLLLSLFIVSGSGVAFADRHNERGNTRKEYRQNNHRNSNGGKHNPGNGGDKGHNDKNKPNDRKGHDINRPGAQHPGGGNHQDPGFHKHHRPTPPPHRTHHVGNHFHRNLGNMVHHAARGGRDIDVWMINADTYVVRYRLGGVLYAQYIYPNAGRYGARTRISVNWSPLTPWIPVPSVNFNINI